LQPDPCISGPRQAAWTFYGSLGLIKAAAGAAETLAPFVYRHAGSLAQIADGLAGDRFSAGANCAPDWRVVGARPTILFS